MLQVYTGNGKGKTTAALGLALRALGAGKRVYLMQFMKSCVYSEHDILLRFAPQLVAKTTGKPFFIAEEGSLSQNEIAALGDVVIFPKGNPPVEYATMIAKGFERVLCEAKGFDVIILDELNVALFFGLLDGETTKEKLEHFMQNNAAEIICTGRNAPPWLVDMADLVTDMQEVKHYYSRGIIARRGIEN